MALSAHRSTLERAGKEGALAPASGQVIYRGALVAVNGSGELVKGTVSTTLKALGRADTSTLDPDYDGLIRFRRGVFRWKNSASSDAITAADIGSTCYI